MTFTSHLLTWHARPHSDQIFIQRDDRCMYLHPANANGFPAHQSAFESARPKTQALKQWLTKSPGSGAGSITVQYTFASAAFRVICVCQERVILCKQLSRCRGAIATQPLVVSATASSARQTYCVAGKIAHRPTSMQRQKTRRGF